MKTSIIHFQVKQAFTLLFIALILVGCLKDKDEEWGEILLSESEKADWFPYSNLNELTYKNSNGDSINLKLTEIERNLEKREDQLIGKTIFYKCERLSAHYDVMVDSFSYTFQVVLEPWVCDKKRMWISAWYYTQIHDNYFDNEYDGDLMFPANIRGCEPDLMGLFNIGEPYCFDKIVINDKTYYNVWAWKTYTGEDELADAKIFVQAKKGLIAFKGLNDEMWVLQSDI